MNNKNKMAPILKTITIALLFFLVGILISACQSPVTMKEVSLPTKKPLISEKAHKEDFEYPTKDPSVVEGKKLFTTNCSSCHGFGQSGKQHNFTLKYINSVPPSHLFKAITSSEKHPSFKDKLSIKERWDVVMYLRYELFGMPQNYDDMMIKFGSNCAVCHGTRGFGDGDIHYFLNPPPANFNQFDRLYEKTDQKLFEEISDGIPWTAMPPWANRFDKDKNFTFDEKFRWELVKYVRHFGYSIEADILRDEKLFKKGTE